MSRNDVEAWQAEEKLRRSEERLRQGVRVAQLGLFEHDHRTDEIYYSSVLRQICGWTDDESVTLAKIIESVAPEDRPAFTAAVQRAHDPAGDGLFITEHRIIRPDGSVRWVSARSQTTFEGEGSVRRAARTIGALVDITERKTAETALTMRERRFRALTEKAAEDIILLDAQGRIIYESPHEVPLLGFAPGEMTGRDGFSLVHPDDLPSAREKFAEVLRGPGATARGEIRMQRRDGGWSWIRFYATNLLHDDAVNAVVLNLHNITERRQAEEALGRLNANLEQLIAERTEALRDSELRIRLFVQHTPAAVAMFDRQMRYLITSRRWLEDYRLGDRDLTGLSHYEVFPELPQAMRDVHQRCLAGEVERSEEDSFTRADGRVDWVRWECCPWRTANGEIGGIILFTEVINERKQAELALKELNETLEQRVVERTAALRDRSERLALLSDAASALLTASDPVMFLDGIFARLSDLLGLEVCVHYAITPSGKHLDLVVSRGLPEEVLPGLQRLEFGQAVCGTVAATGTRMVVNDVQSSRGPLTALIRSLGITAYACHPLVARGRLVGTLSFGTRRVMAFEPESLELIQTVCNQVATAIERKQAEDALRESEQALRHTSDQLEKRVAERTAELARTNELLTAEIAERAALQEEIVAASERERERIGQNLHDGLCQILTAARFKTDSLLTRLEDESPCKRSVKSIASLVVQAVDEARDLARGLEPVEALPEGLMDALQRLASTTCRLFNLACTCEFPRPVLIADHKTATELFRIAQEATNNAIKHSRATEIRIRLVNESLETVLTVTSNGKPFPRSPRSSGMGLKTMRFRSSRIGASLMIERGPEGGTVVRCSLPNLRSEKGVVHERS